MESSLRMPTLYALETVIQNAHVWKGSKGAPPHEPHRVCRPRSVLCPALRLRPAGDAGGKEGQGIRGRGRRRRKGGRKGGRRRRESRGRSRLGRREGRRRR